MRKRLWATMLIAAAISAVAGMAASLDVSSIGTLGAGSTPVDTCDQTIDISYEVEDAFVTHVVVAGIADPSCAGGTLSLTLVDADGTGLASVGPVPVTSGSGDGNTTVTVKLDSPADVEKVDSVHVALVGS